jgi:hypothetical protein
MLSCCMRTDRQPDRHDEENRLSQFCERVYNRLTITSTLLALVVTLLISIRKGSPLNPSWKTDCLTPGFPQSLQVNTLILHQTRGRQLPSPSFPFQQTLITLPLEHNGVRKTPADRAARGVSVSQGHTTPTEY